jgi:hypothetical protein
VIVTFSKKFDWKSGLQNWTYRLVGTFHPVTGLAVALTRSDFRALITDSVRDLRNAFLLKDKELKFDVVTEILPQFSFGFTGISEKFDRLTKVEAAMQTVMAAINEASGFFPSTLDTQLRQERDRDQRPARIDAELSSAGSRRSAEAAAPSLAQHPPKEGGQGQFHCRHAAGLGGEFEGDFAEPNAEQLSLQRNPGEVDTPKRHELVNAMEAQLLLYSMLALALVNVWPEVVAECKAGLGIIMTMCQELAEKTTFTYRDAATHFSKAAQAFGIREVKLRPDEEEDDYEYYDESRCRRYRMREMRPEATSCLPIELLFDCQLRPFMISIPLKAGARCR